MPAAVWWQVEMDGDGWIWMDIEGEYKRCKETLLNIQQWPSSQGKEFKSSASRCTVARSNWMEILVSGSVYGGVYFPSFFNLTSYDIFAIHLSWHITGSNPVKPPKKSFPLLLDRYIDTHTNIRKDTKKISMQTIHVMPCILSCKFIYIDLVDFAFVYCLLYRCTGPLRV